MADQLDISCPSCGKKMKVPANLVGKLIRCKGCESPFEVMTSSGPKPAKPAPAKPVAAKPVKAKPADDAAPMKFKDDPPAVPPPPPPTKRPFDDDDEDDNPNPYGVQKDDFDIPRCPFCAKELDPPDTQICLNCGYNLLERKRHGSKKVYELTKGDYFKHWLPGIIWLIAVIVVFTLTILCFINLGGWMEGSFLENEEKNPITQKATFIVPPFCFNIWIGMFSAFFIYKAGSFVVKRLIINWKPEEVVKKI
jgi:ssDNA-binding Zn-finger/Zn-ribbon topoisomerase 1